MSPALSTGIAYHEAKEALDRLLEVSEHPWEDALILLSRAAVERRATIIEQALWKARFEGLDKAAKYEDLARHWTGLPSPEDATIDAEIQQFFKEDR